MHCKLYDGDKLVEHMPLLINRHLLCQKDDEYDLDYFRRLETDTEEAVPCSVAGAVVVAEEEKTADDEDIEYRQVYPLIGDKVRVDDRENDECADAEEHCKALHDDILTCMLAGRNALNRINAEHGAYETHNEQEHVRPL